MTTLIQTHRRCGGPIRPEARGILLESATMTATLKIDFVSDISCPWCAVGLGALEQALDTLKGEVSAELHFQPFELNPQMPPGGQDITEHLTEKYGSTPEQQAQIRETIRQRGAEVGFIFRPAGRGRIWNTFNAHRLLHWASLEDAAKQVALKKALLAAYQGRGESPESPEVLLAAVAEAGLDGARARDILDSDAFAADVRAQERFYQNAGIHSVPAVIINDRHLISGGQPAAVFEQALRQIAAQAERMSTGHPASPGRWRPSRGRWPAVHFSPSPSSAWATSAAARRRMACFATGSSGPGWRRPGAGRFGRHARLARGRATQCTQPAARGPARL
jgi:predicted DsbA family dithiol-disulfide isomerase